MPEAYYTYYSLCILIPQMAICTHVKNNKISTVTLHCLLLTAYPEKPEIFDFIVFRGSTIKKQIKDLRFIGTSNCQLLTVNHRKETTIYQHTDTDQQKLSILHMLEL